MPTAGLRESPVVNRRSAASNGRLYILTGDNAIRDQRGTKGEQTTGRAGVEQKKQTIL